ncbi:MAG: CapA family protein [Coriobacteriales bacterium]|jgi:poly-gamma-glutamate synthesis protein (capsule biosynthesis protein)|nr:CapA family protein [Coriobacteriales bacterium]
MIPEKLVGICLHLARPFIGKKYRSSWPIEGTMEHLGKGESFYWSYKRFCQPVEEPQPGAGIAERFAPLPVSAIAAEKVRFARAADGAEVGGAAAPHGASRGEDTSAYSHFKAPVPASWQAQTWATVSCAGDILATNAVMEASCANHMFADIASFYLDADLACANLECPVVPSLPASGLPPRSWLEPLSLNLSAPLVQSWIAQGIDLVSTANNHALDQGPEGLRANIQFLKENNCAFVGTASTLESAANAPFCLTVLGDIKVAHIAWTFSLSNHPLPTGHEYLVNYLRLNQAGVDLAPLCAQVDAARAAGADIILAHLHWGAEFEAYPNVALIDNAHRIIEAGVDVIIGNHPHHAQPWEWHPYVARDNTQRVGLILYALGDFLSYQRGLPTNLYASAVGRIKLAKGADAAGNVRAWVSGFAPLPLFQFAVYAGKQCRDVRMLDLARLAKHDFKCSLPGYGLHHKRRARKLWKLAKKLRLAPAV